ncbi:MULTISPECIES: hypothetical protein [Actinomycetes]|uniref:hypothetical protein n=1 Tax=Micromonospora sp. NPDC005367 TaxID=3155590 RepID=UPI0033A8B5E2
MNQPQPNWQAVADAALADYRQPSRSGATDAADQNMTEPDWRAMTEEIATRGFSSIGHEDGWPPLWQLRYRLAHINGSHGTALKISEIEGGNAGAPYRIDSPWSGLYGLSLDRATHVLEGAAFGLEQSWQKRNAPEGGMNRTYKPIGDEPMPIEDMREFLGWGMDGDADEVEWVPEPDWATVRMDAMVAAARHEPPPSVDDTWPALWQLRHAAEMINGRYRTDFSVWEPEPLRYRITHGTWTTGEPVPADEATSILRGITAGLAVTQSAA